MMARNWQDGGVPRKMTLVANGRIASGAIIGQRSQTRERWPADESPKAAFNDTSAGFGPDFANSLVYSVAAVEPAYGEGDLHCGLGLLMPGRIGPEYFMTRGHLHGYAIAQLIQQLSDDLLRVEEGSLYPALQRLELNGWIEGEWGLSASNRRARFYTLTSDGRKHLNAEATRYRQVTGAVARIMGFA